MNKAFIFDMDGVIVNSEPVWERYEKKFLPTLMGKVTYLSIKDQILGNSVSGIYRVASCYGLQMDKKLFEQIYDKYATKVYEEAEITDGIKQLIDKLTVMNFKLGLVSSSRQYWIDLVLEKLKVKDKFNLVLSLDQKSFRPKPFPDGYIEGIDKLDSKPNNTIILEDSQRGIDAGKSSGALTICMQQFLGKNRSAKGADIYLKTIKELIKLIEIIKL